MKKLKNMLSDVGYIIETIIIIAFFSSLAVLFYVRYWPDDSPVVTDSAANGESITFTIHDWEPININTASIRELQKLDGIGEKRAKAIIEYRKENGDFETIEHIIEVNGITEKVFEGIRDEITV
ncbi:MAG: helix-hairpin-helix domain-containing protein [Oscillospiraceae bacterium]|nr:helix-hairpin-helix domain-containing protein [Oscillospiraceae bacterium]